MIEGCVKITLLILTHPHTSNIIYAMKKRIEFIILMIACLTACVQESGFNIKADIAGMPDGLKVYLKNKRQILDSAVTQAGQFTFAGKVEHPFSADIVIETPGNGMFSGRSFDLFLENSDIQIEGQWKDFFKMKITGSALEDEYASYCKLRDSLSDCLLKGVDERYWNVYNGHLYNNTFTAECIPQGIEIAKLQEIADKQLLQLAGDFIKAHPASPVSLKILDRLLYSGSRFTIAELDNWTNTLTPDLKQTATYKEMEKKLSTYRETAKGEKFIDFPVEDVNGKKGMLSDYVQPDKYNMLEVWASWCGHCRVEIPHLKIIQDKYGDRFNIIAVSTDKEDADWRKAMNEDKPNYLQLRAIKDENGKDVMDYYHQNALPYSLLIDVKARIVGADGRGARLDMNLEKWYGE